MNDYIAYCGLDCETCEARIATVNMSTGTVLDDLLEIQGSRK